MKLAVTTTARWNGGAVDVFIGNAPAMRLPQARERKRTSSMCFRCQPGQLAAFGSVSERRERLHLGRIAEQLFERCTPPRRCSDAKRPNHSSVCRPNRAARVSATISLLEPNALSDELGRSGVNSLSIRSTAARNSAGLGTLPPTDATMTGYGSCGAPLSMAKSPLTTDDP